MTKEKYNNLYIFVLGRETKIALLELEQVLRRFCFGFSIITVSGNLVYINIPTDYPPPTTDLIRSLGGTIKIFKIIGEVERDEIVDKTSQQIVGRKSDQGGKTKFGLSNFTKSISRKDVQDMGIKIKMSLKKDLSIRYIENREGGDLQPVVSAKNKLDSKGIEFGFFENVVSKSEDSLSEMSSRAKSGDPLKQKEISPLTSIGRNDNTILLGKLIAVYDPVSWSKRDYGKPKSDKYSGMMPPKLARMLVNITLGLANSKKQVTISKQITNHNNQSFKKSNLGQLSQLEIRNCNDIVVVDPFCGSGNILIEAFSLNCNVVGSDISEKAVNDSTANLGWLIESTESDSNKPQTHHIFQADATSEELIEKLIRHLPSTNHPLVIVAEPYLGKPKKNKPKKEDLKTEIVELKNIYLDFLKNLSKLCCHSALDAESIQRDSRVPPAGEAGKPEDDRGGNKYQFDLKVICLVFPLFELENGDKYSLFSEAVDEIKELGYTPIRNLIYGRDYQIVKREIVFLSLKK